VSALTDARRREEAAAAALERGKAKLRVLQAVLSHFAEGLSASESAARLSLHTQTVKKHRSWLGLALWARGVDSTSTAERG
jgi:DNA-binding CsgD family transcriptional regulator